MTNDLFRDLLDGRLPETPKQRRNRSLAKANEAMALLNDSLVRMAYAFDHGALQMRGLALAANQNRGTGPQPEALRTRGRINRYKEKS